ncbi:MAG: bifunctional pyr operon transcriptional regulator/uracil phosphoribosyltransferase PyrR [Candidatus Omnitrophica bacterium]|nr:bifunctional pyr operon transcriptional regulator/uracil phosphoribosyltransferase PyrR [Candidatus Omnitrophota bacterium]MDD4012757.1 bifunctional pyr operon transcriptional regulator/uracil phosphoribosyltransferase PyrR [Candidatus Omnitrophota bacterium]
MEKNARARILDKEGIERTLQRISHEIVEKNQGATNLAVIGIKTRGAVLAEKIAANIKAIEKKEVPLGAIDITLYRDDLTEIAKQPLVHATEINFDITGKRIILVDDVLYTGRTVRCALDELIDFGRPACIQLAVLIDRGHRELPIRPDYVGKNIPTAKEEQVEVRLEGTDGEEEVVILQ